ncbi:DUF222 domain-containing protein [Kribbella sp. NPDC048928]|uniref:HNH endonuclease signature motif containing protein n=1 Tax=Kribbella sp. NPDC048928 TaxID=3364111 RepID=UPI003710959D
MTVAIDPMQGEPAWLTPAATGRMTAELSAETATIEAAGGLVPPADLCDPDGPDGAIDPCFVDWQDPYDDMYGDAYGLPAMSRIDALEWELWAGAEQDEAERVMLRLKAPAWVSLPPGAELAAELDELRPGCESPVALIEAMKAAARMEAWAASIRTETMAAFVRQRKAQLDRIPRPAQIDSSGRPIDPERSWTAEIGAALHLSKETAARHIDTALHLSGTLAATRTALRCGALSLAKALSISEATRSLSPDAARTVEAHVLRRAAGQTHRNLAASLRRQVAKHAAEEESDQHRQAVTERTCKIVPLPDGMAGLWVVHTADKIQQMWIAVQALADLTKRATPSTPTTPTTPTTPATPATPATPDATTESLHATTESHDATPGAATAGTETSSAITRSESSDNAHLAEPAEPDQPAGSTRPARPGNSTGSAWPGASAGSAEVGVVKDERTAPQRRADVVADLFGQILHNGLDWLGRRLPDQHRRRPHIEVLIPITTLIGMDDDPCELTGYGPIPATMARRVAGDGTWRRLLTDPANGTVLEASTTRHDPGVLVTETLLARHPTCAWPGCNRTSRTCDRDHAIPFAQSGRTSLSGMVPYCEYHHVIKDTPAWGWKTTAHADGSVTLTTPTGHRYTTVPPARGPIAHPPQQPQRQPSDDPAPF